MTDERPEPTWQAIESAPKDGTWVLLKGGEQAVGWDNEYAAPPAVVGQFVWHEGLNAHKGYWQFAWYEDGHYGGYENPQEWMPIP